MTATVVVQEGNGSPVTWTTITQGRYCTADTYNPGDNYTCAVPSSGYNYGYWKHFRLGFSGSFGKISNIRWFTSGSIKTNWNLGTGGMLLVARKDSGDNGCPTANYDQARGVQGTTGYYLKDPSNGHSYYKGETVDPADADNYTSASPLVIDSTEYTSSGYSKSVVTQPKLAPDATQGDKPNETFTFRYDET
ncbi:MAG: hypothetical protein GYA36_23335 [Veillonellaceae bacterium]|nr:hypothetical protein [Veillonellaceae bacterium]